MPQNYERGKVLVPLVRGRGGGEGGGVGPEATDDDDDGDRRFLLMSGPLTYPGGSVKCYICG